MTSGTRAVPLTLAIPLLHTHVDSPGCISTRAQHAHRLHFVVGLKSSQILLCHKLFQLRRHAIISLITFYFDERSRRFLKKCVLYRVRRIFISILGIFWHELCLRPSAGSRPCRGTCISPATATPALGARRQQSDTGFFFAESPQC